MKFATFAILVTLVFMPVHDTVTHKGWGVHLCPVAKGPR